MVFLYQTKCGMIFLWPVQFVLSEHLLGLYSKYSIVAYLYDSWDWQAEDVIIKVQAPTAPVWDPPMQLLCFFASYQQQETNHSECWVIGLGQQQFLGQEPNDS